MSNDRSGVPDKGGKKILKFAEDSFGSDSYTFQLIDSDTNIVIREVTDHTGYHTCGFVSDNGDLAIYMTFDKNWYFNPIINIWNLRTDKVQTIMTKHHPQSIWMEMAYANRPGKLFLGGVDGSLSAHNIKALSSLWYFEREERSFDHPNRCVAISGNGQLVCAVEEDSLSVLEFGTGKIIMRHPISIKAVDCGFQDKDQSVFVVNERSEREFIRINN